MSGFRSTTSSFMRHVRLCLLSYHMPRGFRVNSPGCEKLQKQCHMFRCVAIAAATFGCVHQRLDVGNNRQPHCLLYDHSCLATGRPSSRGCTRRERKCDDWPRTVDESKLPPNYYLLVALGCARLCSWPEGAPMIWVHETARRVRDSLRDAYNHQVSLAQGFACPRMDIPPRMISHRSHVDSFGWVMCLL